MFKPLANPESLIIIGSFSYLLTKSDWFGDTVMLVLDDRNYTAMHTHVRWSVHLSALLIT
jgi:hypothetical protein